MLGLRYQLFETDVRQSHNYVDPTCGNRHMRTSPIDDCCYLSCRLEITGEFGLVNVGSTVQGDSAKVFPVHTASSAVNDPLAQHHTCQCTVARPSDCDAGQRSQASRCYTATCPTGTMDRYRSCTCAWAHETDHSPPHGCTAEVHCAIESGQPLPPNCSSDAVWYDILLRLVHCFMSKLRRHKNQFY